MIDNFHKIKPLLTFGSDDDFYHAQIIKRRKENPELKSNSYTIKHYFIKTTNELDELKGEMESLCKYHNARACINLNKRSFRSCAFHTLKKITDQIFNGDFKSVRKSYTSVCGAHSAATEKRWIIDVDTKGSSIICRILNTVVRDYVNVEKISKIITIRDFFINVIKTPNGYHLITKPFNTNIFKQIRPGIEIHKDNPTILLAMKNEKENCKIVSYMPENQDLPIEFIKDVLVAKNIDKSLAEPFEF